MIILCKIETNLLYPWYDAIAVIYGSPGRFQRDADAKIGSIILNTPI